LYAEQLNAIQGLGIFQIRLDQSELDNGKLTERLDLPTDNKKSVFLSAEVSRYKLRGFLSRNMRMIKENKSIVDGAR